MTNLCGRGVAPRPFAPTVEAYRRYVRRQPCLIARHSLHQNQCPWGHQYGSVHAHHVRARGMGGAHGDILIPSGQGNLVPLCYLAHAQLHAPAWGRVRFEDTYGVDLRSEAEASLQAWLGGLERAAAMAGRITWQECRVASFAWPS